jgi:hypothetical protein
MSLCEAAVEWGRMLLIATWLMNVELDVRGSKCHDMR